MEYTFCGETDGLNLCKSFAEIAHLLFLMISDRIYTYRERTGNGGKRDEENIRDKVPVEADRL